MFDTFRNHYSRRQQHDLANGRLYSIAMKAVETLRDTVHSMGWSSSHSSEFSPYEQYIQAADTIGNAIFNSTHLYRNFYESEAIFQGQTDQLGIADFTLELSQFDLGPLGQLRDELVKHPTYEKGLHLMSELLWHTMTGVHDKRMCDQRAKRSIGQTGPASVKNDTASTFGHEKD